MAGNITRLGSNSTSLSDVRIDRVSFPEKVKRAFPDMVQTENEINARLQSIQTALNELASVVKLKE